MKEQTYGIRELQRLMARLRDPDTGCPWDLKQTYQSIAPFTLEECLELIDALEQNDFDHVEEELGDLLFQVIFYAQLGKEEGRFDFDTVVSRITTKLLRRHPHVFKDGDLEGVITDRASIDSIKNNWEAEKAAERAARAQQSAMDDIPTTLSALARAQKLQKRGASLGYDFLSSDEVLSRLDDELDELSGACQNHDPEEIENELGDVLFTVVNLARHLKVDAEASLRKANRRFEQRVRRAESAAIDAGSRLQDESAERLEERWSAAKAQERKDDL
jgi:ATP diphosphatase